MKMDLGIINVSNGLTSKADGKDKLLATLQYVLMFVSGGQPGVAKDLQIKVAAARKVFRIMKPMETLTPLLKEPYLPGRKPMHHELLPKIRSLFMAIYFTFDHAVWLGSVNIIKDKNILEKCQKASLWGWLLGSIATITLESVTLSDGSMAVKRMQGEDEQSWQQRRAELSAATHKRALTLVHAIIQALLATGLLQLRPFKPRLTASFGVAASVLNCYMLSPPWPVAIHKVDAKLA
eukprot:jgi/Ulvmu1/4359/UM002_0084.1